MITCSSNSPTWVAMGRLPGGGVSITLMSRRPDIDICRVRGMGVALMASTSTFRRSCLRASFCDTPKRCSSSTMTKPRSLGCTSIDSTRWVPMRMSSSPDLKAASAFFTSPADLNRLTMSTLTGRSAKRSRNVARCCWARMVVGTSTSTCLPPAAALNAARMATSVLPNPTSPHTRRSMGIGRSMSSVTSSMARCWSGVSWYGNRRSSSRVRSSSGGKANPSARPRASYSEMSSPASSRTDSRARAFMVFHDLPPSLLSAGALPSAPTYRDTFSRWSCGTYRRSSPANTSAR